MEGCRIHNRHHQHIAVIGTPRTTQVCMTETIDQRIGIIISCTSFPAIIPACIGTQLHHPEGNGRTGIGMAYTTGTGHRIDVFCIGLSQPCSCDEGQQEHTEEGF